MTHQQQEQMMKRVIATVIAVAITTSSFARDAVVTFSNGGTHTYQDVPDTVTDTMVRQRATSEFPMANVKDVEFTGYDIDWKKTATNIGIAVVVGALAAVAIRSVAVKSHPCTNPSDRASDGSICGGRASSVRPGGA